MVKKFLIISTIVFLALSGTVSHAKSKYSDEFIAKFTYCQAYSESKYNVIYNSDDTYTIKGYVPDGTETCIYEETNSWDKGTYQTTCKFEPKQHEEYLNAMRNPDVKTSVTIKGMAFVDANENAVYLKYYNNPNVCTTKKIK